jgi:hypothetical protein
MEYKNFRFLSLAKADNKKHKYVVIFDNRKQNKKKMVYFGQYGAKDYIIYNEMVKKEEITQHDADERKRLYIARHKKNEDHNNWLTAGFWSLHLLWNKQTMEESLKDIFKKYPDMTKKDKIEDIN